MGKPLDGKKRGNYEHPGISVNWNNKYLIFRYKKNPHTFNKSSSARFLCVINWIGVLLYYILVYGLTGIIVVTIILG